MNHCSFYCSFCFLVSPVLTHHRLTSAPKFTPSFFLNKVHYEAVYIKEEFSDAFLFIAGLPDKLDIDIKKVALDKIEINRIKYPIELSKGNSDKYNRKCL